MVKCLLGGQIGLNKGFTFVAAIALTAVMSASIADAGTLQKSKRKSSGSYSGPETGLLGVKLYDSGLRVISLYGSPDSIQAVGASTTSNSPGAGGPPGGFGGAGGGGGNGSGGGNQASRPSADPIIPGDLIPGTFGDPIPNMQRGGGGSSGAPGLSPAPGGPGGKGGAPAPSGGPGGPGGAPSPGGKGGPGGAGGGNGASESAVFTRWSYTRNGSKLAFVLDKFNRVIQIEAIGLQNQRIKTRRGIGFGSSFSQVMKAYAPTADPDGYDINGNNFTIRFLTRQRVAFRLTQLSTKKAHVVTGIVVAAGKQ